MSLSLVVSLTHCLSLPRYHSSPSFSLRHPLCLTDSFFLTHIQSLSLIAPLPRCPSHSLSLSHSFSLSLPLSLSFYHVRFSRTLSRSAHMPSLSHTIKSLKHKFSLASHAIPLARSLSPPSPSVRFLSHPLSLTPVVSLTHRILSLTHSLSRSPPPPTVSLAHNTPHSLAPPSLSHTRAFLSPPFILSCPSHSPFLSLR